MLCFKTFKDYVSVCVCVYVYLCGVCVCINVGAHTGQKKASDPLELELQVLPVPGTEPRSSVRAVRALNY